MPIQEYIVIHNVIHANYSHLNSEKRVNLFFRFFLHIFQINYTSFNKVIHVSNYTIKDATMMSLNHQKNHLLPVVSWESILHKVQEPHLAPLSWHR